MIYPHRFFTIPKQAQSKMYLPCQVKPIYFQFLGSCDSQTGQRRSITSTLRPTITVKTCQRASRDPGRGFCGSRSCGRALDRGALVSRVEDEGAPNSSLSMESRSGITTCVLAPGTDVSTGPPYARLALKIGLLATEDSVVEKRDRSLDERNHFRMETCS